MSGSDSTSGSKASEGGAPSDQRRKTLLFANDKSSGKTTTANAVLASLLQHHKPLLHNIVVHEYDRQPRLAAIWGKEDGFAGVYHHDARNAAAFDASREIAYDPNATIWDELLYNLGAGGVIIDLGANIFADICRILDDEPRPVFPEGGETIGVVVPVTTARDSIDSGIVAIDNALSWGKRVRVFAVEQEYLGRFEGNAPGWSEYRDRMQRTEQNRFDIIRIERLLVADIGRVVFQRIDKLVAEATRQLQSGNLQGAEYIRAIRKARSELTWGGRTLEAVQPIADWFAR
ncbi:MAG: hypothetical protein JO264_16495 [Acidisphaera sp.]|nr:hypothetical protein [Acidisphaera sp.]